MRRRRLIALSGALLAGALSGCTALSTGPKKLGEQAQPGIAPDVDDETLSELARETNDLAFDLYGELTEANPGENLLVSPVSVTTALSMAYAGARGETREQMREALHYTLDGETHHGAFNALQRKLNERGDNVDEEDIPDSFDSGDDPVPFQLNLVNAAWGQEGFPFRESYLETLEDHYGGGLRKADYRSDPEAARREINDWVADRTVGRITDLLPAESLSKRTRLVLTNALYFKANWLHTFDEGSTTREEFTSLDGEASEVPMMDQSVSVPYAEVDGAKAVDLPYLGEEVSMLLILPPEGKFESYEQSMDRSTIRGFVDSFESLKIDISLPRFEFASSFSLPETLAELGMPIAFGRWADFSGMAPEPPQLRLDDVFHDTYIAADEQGTEAAAASAVEVVAVSGPAGWFTANRPFLFAIRDRPTGTILFLGRVIDAAAAQ
jgi:serpin B